MSSVLLDDYVEVANGIKIKNPTIREIYNFGEEAFWRVINTLTIIPSDIKWSLWQSKIDYMKISEFELFIKLAGTISNEESLFLFDDLVLGDFELFFNKKTEKIFLKNKKGIIIDDEIYSKIADYFRLFNGSKKKIEKAANKHTKMILIEESRRNALKNKDKKFVSILDDLIISLVCSPEFPYNYETVGDVKVIPFMKSVKQINKRIYALATIQGSMSGFVDTTKIKKENFEWMATSKN